MIQVITSSGISLDLDPSAEFAIEYENPMLDDSHCPVPYSTAIAFLPSSKNKKAFGYVESMMLEPANVRLAAMIEIAGVLAFSGTLQYDSIEDGRLNYTFNGASPEASWEKRLWQLAIFPYTYPSGRNAMVSAVARGEVHGVSAPLIVNKAAVADSIYTSDDGKVTAVETAVKYRNLPSLRATGDRPATVSGFMPAITFPTILKAAGISWLDSADLEGLAVIGRYSPDIVSSYESANRRSSKTGTTANDEATLDLAMWLPDVSVADFVKGIGKMLCGAVYPDGTSYAFVGFDDIAGGEAVNWEAKVSDVYSAEREDAMEYALSYEGDLADGKYDVEKLAGDLADNNVLRAGKLQDVTRLYATDYQAILFEGSKDIYSGRKFTSGGKSAYLTDVVYHNVSPVGGDGGGDAKYDSSTGFTLPYCVPEVLYRGDTPLYLMAPVVEVPKANSDRDSKVYVGYAVGGQMTDSGYYFDGNGVEAKTGKPISPGQLYVSHHEAFANWISKPRQRVSVDLNLTGLDLGVFRMDRLVWFRGHTWVPAKLTVTLRAGSDTISSRGEFVSFK